VTYNDVISGLNSRW